MKKILVCLIMLVSSLTFSGCVIGDSMDGIKIATTVYPIEYIIKSLYSNHSTIISIYPYDTKDPMSYKLTDKQLTDISSSNLLIYNGLSNEGDYATKVLAKNRNVKIIDASMGMEVAHGIEELWLNPSNMMMLLQNIRNGLNKYVDSSYLVQEIEKNYEITKLQISEIDAELKNIAEFSDLKTIVVADDSFKFLEKYGITVISLEENDQLTAKSIQDAKDLIKNGNIKYIYVTNKGTNKTINNIISQYNIELLEINMLNSISENELKDKIDYITIMNNNIELLKKELYR